MVYPSESPRRITTFGCLVGLAESWVRSGPWSSREMRFVVKKTLHSVVMVSFCKRRAGGCEKYTGKVEAVLSFSWGVGVV